MREEVKEGGGGEREREKRKRRKTKKTKEGARESKQAESNKEGGRWKEDRGRVTNAELMGLWCSLKEKEDDQNPMKDQKIDVARTSQHVLAARSNKREREDRGVLRVAQGQWK